MYLWSYDKPAHSPCHPTLHHITCNIRDYRKVTMKSRFRRHLPGCLNAHSKPQRAVDKKFFPDCKPTLSPLNFYCPHLRCTELSEHLHLYAGRDLMLRDVFFLKTNTTRYYRAGNMTNNQMIYNMLKFQRHAVSLFKSVRGGLLNATHLTIN